MQADDHEDPLSWPPCVSLSLEEHLLDFLYAFDHANLQDSEHDMYEAVNNGFEYPLEWFMDHYGHWLHWTPQGALEYRKVSERTITEKAKPETAQRSSPTQDSEEGIHFDDATTGDPAVISSTSNAPESSLDRDMDELHMRRLTDFLLAVSRLDSDGAPGIRKIVAVVEAKKVPSGNKILTAKAERKYARSQVTSSLPQLLQQAQLALKKNPTQDLVWGILVIGRYCHFYKFLRSKLDTLDHKVKLKPEETKEYAGRVGALHRMVSQDGKRYGDPFVAHMNTMMEWANEMIGKAAAA